MAALKKDIQEDVSGIAFIQKLRPVSYKIDFEKLDQQYYRHLPEKDRSEAMKKNASRQVQRESGFIAQEVEEAVKQSGFSFNGVDKPDTKDGFYGLRYAEFVVPLVKAVQEQQLMIDQLKESVENLKKELDTLKGSPVRK